MTVTFDEPRLFELPQDPEWIRAQRREAALVAATSEDAPWRLAAMEAVLDLCEARDRFTSEDVWTLLDERGARTARRMLLGVVMQQAKRLGICAPLDEWEVVRSPKPRPARLWQSLIESEST